MTHFLKAIADDHEVQIADFQSSAMLNTFAVCNAFIVIPENVESLQKNDMTEVYLFGNG
ncbi:MAG: hypothetical protein JNJ99_09975 [Crocinitomicaceae bacterium]|nr:hypothetical protein [Crocinitomicaceae bacterium]